MHVYVYISLLYSFDPLTSCRSKVSKNDDCFISMRSSHISGILSPPDLPSWEFYKYFSVINESEILPPPPASLEPFFFSF